jgi:hypothetical protein
LSSSKWLLALLSPVPGMSKVGFDIFESLSQMPLQFFADEFSAMLNYVVQNQIIILIVQPAYLFT